MLKEENQLTFADLGISSGKTSPEPSHQKKEKTSRQSSKKSSGSSSRKPPPVSVPEKGWPTSGCIYDDMGRWSVAWRVHDAQFWGVPQRRRRIALVADFGGLSAPEVLFERKVLRWDPAQSGKTRQGAAADAERSSGGSISFQERGGKPGGGKGILIQNERTGALSTLNNQIVFNIGSYHSNDALNCGYPACNQGGTAVVGARCFNQLSQSGIYKEDETSVSLTVCGGTYVGGSECLAVYNGAGTSSNNQPVVFDARGNGDGEPVCTITGDHENSVTDYTAICMQNTGQGWWNGSQIGATLRTPSGGDSTKANLLVTYQEVTGPIMANSHPGSYTGQDAYNDMLIAGIDARNGEEVYAIDHAITTGGNCTAQGQCVYKNIEATLKSSGVHAVSYESVDGTNCIKKHVRRLTPLECERLQGYPDGWTDIGEWIDSKGKRHDSSDSARYKALGNSIALPFWHWLMRRISAQYVGTPTLGSLFDGIGGFPLCWERINGKGTALWASEIEEFPIAVTKYHFGG